MKSVHARMRRAVEKESRDMDAKLERTAGDKKPKKSKIRRQPVNIFLVILVLSPVIIIWGLIYLSKLYARWAQADADLDEVVPGKMNGAEHEDVNLHGIAEGLKAAAAAGGSPQRLRKKSADVKYTKDFEQDWKPIVRHHEKLSHDKANWHEYLILTTKHGNIKITLRPDLSEGSVDYIHRLVKSYGDSRCMHCNFYRSEKPGILQGIMEHKGVVPVNTVRGSCPKGAEDVPNDCPSWDKHCACHGPVMTRGAVAWAAGDAGGPDFFINGYPEPAKWWGTQHTNFGFIDDPASMKVVDAIFELPVDATKDMDYLKDPIHFDLLLV